MTALWLAAVPGCAVALPQALPGRELAGECQNSVGAVLMLKKPE